VNQKKPNAMKRKTNSHNMSLMTIIGIFLLPLATLAMKETETTIIKEISVSPETLISFENKIGPLTVETWNQQAVKVVTRVIVDGTPEDVAKLLDYLNGIDFTSSSGSVSFNTRFYSMYSSTFPGGTRIVLNNNELLKGITRLELSYTLTVPGRNSLSITNKYEKITFPDLSGNLNLKLYESNFTGGNIGGKATIELKYSKGTLGQLQNTSLNLYESGVEILQTGSLDLTSKYSHITVNESGPFTFNCYEDKVIVEKHGDISGKAKYTGLKLNDFSIMKADLYECTLTAGKGNNLELRAKYCVINLTEAGSVSISEGYELKFTAMNAGTLNALSKYSTYNIGRLETSMQFSDSYEDNINISSTGTTFTGCSLQGKYTDLTLNVNPSVLYKIEASLQYTDLDFRESAFREIRYHKDGSNFQYQGVIKGGDESTAATVELKMYEGKAIIR